MLISVPLSKSNQITLPSAVRKLLKLQPGECIAFDTETRTFTKAETDEEKIRRVFRELDEWRESLPTEVKANIKRHAGWTINQYHEFYDNTPEHKAILKEKYGLQD